MTLKLLFDVALLLSSWSIAGCDFNMEGVLQMECHERHVMIALDLSATGTDPHFEAVDGTGVYPITDEYASKCGYSVSILPFLGLAELRASYFSCNTESKDDVFTFKFNLVTNHNAVEAFYALNKTCSPPSPWSPREVTCEVNYMEVSVRTEFPCPSGTNEWDSLKLASSTSDWQVAFQRPEEQLSPMNLTQARKLGYVFDLLLDRIVFRTPYGQHESYNTKVNGIPVEVVHAAVFSRKSWIVLMVDLVAACSTHEGSYNSGYMFWSTPEALYASYNRSQLSVGLNGELMEPETAAQKGFIMEMLNSTIKIGIPYNADGGFRKTFVSNGIFEFYIFYLHMKQTLVDERSEETTLRFHRTLISPLLPCTLVTEDRTIKAEGMFTIYLEVPRDVQLTSVQLNGQGFKVPFGNNTPFILAEAHLNKTQSFTLKVPLHDPVVIQQFSEQNAAMFHKLDVNYTLTAVPENEPYYHTVSVKVLMDVSPPSFNSVCNASGISFELAHRSYDYLWDISIGPDQLTLELAAKRGYIISNSSNSLLVFVPLFAKGFEYKNIGLKKFLGTFEILVKSRDKPNILTSTVKTCQFNSTELIICSTNGWMTVVTDLFRVLPNGQIPTGTHLSNNLCVAKEMDGTKVLYSFPLNSCGSVVKLSRGNVVYQNQIFYYFGNSSSTEGLTMQCTYPLTSLYSLFSTYRFDSDKEGVGSIIYPLDNTKVFPSTTVPPAETRTTTASHRTRSPNLYMPSFYPTARYIRVYRTHNLLGSYKAPPESVKVLEYV
ncbi:zona pellucida protein AX 4 [Nematolebias whitei]|uniref:zona pellucida protein AX 4 n=1 Tax=Nematolebias whitei TaxID=451745 RepID=UPI001899114D|nr:zona pellucida protein AX 4 [Nematolebias whitei]